MGILQREVGEVELIPVAKGIIARWWIVLLAALVGVVAMWSQESDLSTTPSLTEVVRTYESRDETALLSLVGIDPSTVSPFPSFEHQILQIQEPASQEAINSKLGFDVNISITRSEQRFSLLDTVEGDGKTKFTFLSVGTPIYTLWCSDASVDHCNSALDEYQVQLQQIRQRSIVSGLDRLQQLLEALPVQNQSIVEKIDGLKAAKPLIKGELALLSTTTTAVGATVSTVKASTYLFGAIGGLIVGLLIALQLTLLDKRVRSIQHIAQTVESSSILGQVSDNPATIQHVAAAIVARAHAASIASISLVPVENGSGIASLASQINAITSPLGVSVTGLSPISSLPASELVSNQSGMVLIAVKKVSRIEHITSTWHVLASANKLILGVVLAVNAQ